MDATICFKYFWPGFNTNDNIFTEMIKHYNIKLTSKITMISCFNNKFLKDGFSDEEGKVVYWVGENYRPLDWVDLNLTFDKDGEKNIRLPLWVLYYIANNSQGHCMGQFNCSYHLYNPVFSPNGGDKFCSYVSSHGGVRFRDRLVKQLNQYKTVDCGGMHLNNMPGGGVVGDKIEFQKQYKFCIAAECYKQPGYVTEKILDAFKSGCIPIYRGAPDIEEDFNKETFINANFLRVEELLSLVEKIDNDDDLYKSYFNKPILTEKWLLRLQDPGHEYLKHICRKICFV
jgi:hypothetical protein